MQPEEVSRLLTKELSTYLKGPLVTILVQTAQSSRVLVMGAVGRPGEFVLNGPARLLDVLARAGGLSYRDTTGQHPVIADLGRATVMRGRRLIPVDFSKLLLSGDVSQNVYLEAGDVVHLPPLYEKDVMVLGEVAVPGTVRYSPHLTLLTALSQVGGLGEDARSGQVRVIRGSLSVPRVFLVDVDDMFGGHRTDVPLRPGDVVFVTTTALADWNRVIEQLLPTLRALLTTRYLIEGAPSPLWELGQ